MSRRGSDDGILAKRPIREIPLKDLLWLLKQVYENSRIVERVEIETINWSFSIITGQKKQWIN